MEKSAFYANFKFMLKRVEEGEKEKKTDKNAKQDSNFKSIKLCNYNFIGTIKSIYRFEILTKNKNLTLEKNLFVFFFLFFLNQNFKMIKKER